MMIQQKHSDHTEPASCGCGHDHEHEDANDKYTLPRLILGAGLLAVAIIMAHTLPRSTALTLLFYLLPYLLVGWNTLRESAEHIAHGAVFDENFLMSVASIGAFFVGEYAEGVTVMLLFCLGEWLQNIAVGRTRASVRALMELRPDTARIVSEEEDEDDDAVVPVAAIGVGATIEVRPGERIPLDGTVIGGCANLDTSALTGESVPQSTQTGDAAAAGCICTDGVLRIRVTRTAGESTVQRILDLAQNAQCKKTRTEAFITRFARVYTPIVVLAAVALAVIPSLLTGMWETWIYRALTFLVVSCPCALVISVPLSFFCGIGASSKQGILIKGSTAIEALSKTAIIATDKTGTLTRGEFSVASIDTDGITPDELLCLCANAERVSSHPAARGIVRAYEERFGHAPDGIVTETVELSGRGIRAMRNGTALLCGNERLMRESGISVPPSHNDPGACTVYVAQDNGYLGAIHLCDTPKEDAAAAIRAWRSLGVREIHMLTGDTPGAAQPLADALGLDACHAGLLPDGKMAVAETLLSSLENKDGTKTGTLLCIGDGINDAPLLARADVGCAMGSLGSDAAMEAADVVILNDTPSKTAEAIAVARKTMRIAKQNIVFALGVKAAILMLGAVGITGMGAAVFGDVGVCMLCILNAARLNGFQPKHLSHPLDVSKMTKEQLDEEIMKGYRDMVEGRTRDANAVFDDICKDFDVKK